VVGGGFAVVAVAVAKAETAEESLEEEHPELQKA
jgi:hypothetical protein